MPNPHALVSAVSNVRPADDGPAPDSAFLVGTTPLPGGDYWIDFANAEYAPARLPCNHPRFDAYLEMISDLTTGSRPMYFEVSDAAAAKRAITRAAPVRICRVRSVGPIDAFVIVRLSASHTDHVLRSTSPDFEALYRQLKDAEGKADAFVCISESSRS